jgi:glycosidase
MNMRVLLDIVFNHTGNNWTYANGNDQPPYLPWPQFYAKGQWRDRQGNFISQIQGPDDGVWPKELWDDSAYTRAGEGDLGEATLTTLTPNIAGPISPETETSTMTGEDRRLHRHDP